MKKQIERRSVPLVGVEIRAEEGEAPKITGHAAVFNSLSEELWGFRERIDPGAFAKTIQEADVRALWNHDRNYVIGRNKSGTLRLSEDDQGLLIEADPPDTQWARDLIVTMERGDVDQMSFGFRTVKERWEGTLDDPVRVLEEVELFDVSPVTYPAYPETDVSVRSAILERGKEALGHTAEPWKGPHSAEEDDPPQGRRTRILRTRVALAERS